MSTLTASAPFKSGVSWETTDTVSRKTNVAGIRLRLEEFDRLCDAIHAASAEEMPSFERVNFSGETNI